MTTIDIDLLRSAFARILDKLDRLNVGSVELDYSLYRQIPTDKWNNFTSSDIHVGDLDDDVQELHRMTSDPDRPCTFVDFDRTAALLRAISQQLNPPAESARP